MQNGRKNIVIGGSGFIGSALCKNLQKRNEPVLNVSRELNNDLSIEQIKFCIGEEDGLAQHLKGGENIFLLTGQMCKNFSSEKELKILKQILEAVDPLSVKNIFYFSSVFVYGETNDTTSENGACSPIDEYSKLKVESEKVVREYKNTNVIILRLSNVYGDLGNRGIIGLVLKNIFENNKEKIFINGNGMQKRDYIFIDDVVEAVLFIKDRISTSDTINISIGKSYSLIHILEKISEIFEKKVNFSINDNKTNEIEKSLISNKKLVEKYGFSPKYDLDKGLDLTIKRYQQFYECDC